MIHNAFASFKFYVLGEGRTYGDTVSGFNEISAAFRRMKDSVLNLFNSVMRLGDGISTIASISTGAEYYVAQKSISQTFPIQSKEFIRLFIKRFAFYGSG